MSKAKVIDGRSLAEKLLSELKRKISQSCGLATILVGYDPASKIYVANKRKQAASIGITSYHYDLEKNTSEQAVLELIKKLNADKNIHGILVQLPLPKHIREHVVIETICPTKDVDGFHPVNMGYLLRGDNKTVACTPLGVMHMLASIGYNLTGKHAVVVGRSNIVGKPMAQLLLQKDATVTNCHRYTNNLALFTKQADVLITAVGQANLITKNHVKPDCVVIDVGMNRDQNNNLCGDVDYQQVSQVASYITPVPGGVGPLTIAMLLKNTLENFNRIHNDHEQNRPVCLS